MNKIVLIGEVASLAREIEVSKINLGNFGVRVNHYVSNEETGSVQSGCEDTVVQGGLTGFLDKSSRRAELNAFLGEWEEPDAIRKAVS